MKSSLKHETEEITPQVTTGEDIAQQEIESLDKCFEALDITLLYSDRRIISDWVKAHDKRLLDETREKLEVDKEL